MIDTSAALMIALIQQLYQVEQAAVDLDRDGRRALATHPQRLIEQLTPRRWAETFGPQSSV
jgi:hypothetical protein